MSRRRGRRPPARVPDGPNRRPLWWVAAIAAAAVLVIVAVVATRPEPFRHVDPGLVAEGAALYRASCAMCHGEDLQGTNHGPPLIHAIYAPDHHADEAFQRAVAFGVVPHHWGFGPMPPIPGLERDDVAKIVAFVRSEQIRAGIFEPPGE
jgi:mono/diheme cytochrome c family protein